jgi:thiosulfate/3-mercaptopyruvate sulfurtransferase
VIPSPLISAEALRARLAAGPVRLLDARSGKDAAQAHAAGHLPGALHVSLDHELAAPVPDFASGGRHPLPPPDRFAAQLGRWGITPSTPVVVYDDQGGANAAARVWWMLRALGHPHVQVLDGGLAAATAAGLPLVSTVPTVEAASPYPARAWRLPTVDLEEVDAARGDGTRVVLDVRAPPRYRGDTEPFDPVAGHIPGARNAPYADNLDAAGRFKAPEQLRALYQRLLGQVPVERAIIHCGSGVTACHTLLALEHAGLPGAALYVGSWSEWCRAAGRPVARGEAG